MQTFMQYIEQYGLFAMVLIIFLEYACFPVSSEIILPFSGAFASAADIPFLLMLLLSVIAGLMGTSICYALGRYGGNALIGRVCHKYPKLEKGINASKDKFESYGNPAVLFGRMIPLCRTYIAFIAGTARQPFKKYILFSSIGITIWNAILIGIGYLMHENWNIAAYYYNNYKNAVIPIVLLAVLGFIFVKQCKVSKNA